MKQGDKFGRLIALAPAGRTKSGAPQWRFQCDCGAVVDKHAWNVKTGHTQSCGCWQRERTTQSNRDRLPEISVGQRFGHLSAVRPLPHGRGRTRWVFVCDCGVEAHLPASDAISGHTQSCGCRVYVNLPMKHGESHFGRTAEYTAWKNIKARCFNPKNDKYAYYGGRGITMAPEWIDDYEAFLSHIGRRPSPEHSVDRIDNDGNYEPGNVRWATPLQQRHNRRDKAAA